METIYNRGPEGLDNQTRRFNLFSPEANDTINQSVVAPQVLWFRDHQAHQKIEIEKIDVNVQEGIGEATTLAYGQLVRTSLENGIYVNRMFNVKVFFTWKSNLNPVTRSMYPTICTDVNFFSTIQTYP